MAQSLLLIWLDNHIDDSNSDYENTIVHVQRLVKTINIFTDANECIEFINTVSNDKVCITVPGYAGRDFVPRIHDMSQIDSIYIFCGNKKHQERWTKEWFKIKGIYTEISSICEAITQTAKQYEQSAISISLIATDGDMSTVNLDQVDSSFMYTQILNEILLCIGFELKNFREFIDYCRHMFASNERELKNVMKIEHNYREHTPIWWYTYECFLYSMLNKALRTMDVNIIILFGFYIGDLHRQIEQLHMEQFGDRYSSECFTVYRGQGMSIKQFEEMSQIKGGLIAFNHFLSTSTDRDVSLHFTNIAVSNPDVIGILFVMTIDPSKSTTPFASISKVACYEQEAEILFSMQTVFRIVDIKPMSENHRLFEVNLKLTSHNDMDLRALTDRIRNETFPREEGWYRLGKLLLTMGEPEKAEQVYERILEQTTNNKEKAPIYHQLGWAKKKQGEYKLAIEYYEKALDIDKETLSPNHPDFAMSYIGIGNVYADLSDYWKALSYYEKALEIQERSLAPNHSDLASTYNNIGNVYNNMEDYSKALKYYEKDKEISQNVLPEYHPDLAVSENNIGSVYEEMGEYSKAHSYYERAVKIGERSLPPNHSDLQDYRANLDRVKNQS